jgi:3-hydroxyacyl-[acyl-carrier-protein] dehydratase
VSPEPVRADLCFAATHPAFAGHFPGRPIVPAVALLAEVLASVESATGNAAQGFTVANAKFLKPVLPGEVLVLVHEGAHQGGRRFEVRSGDVLVAMGVLSPVKAP